MCFGLYTGIEVVPVGTCFVCALMMWSDWGLNLGEGANLYFS